MSWPKWRSLLPPPETPCSFLRLTSSFGPPDSGASVARSQGGLSLGPSEGELQGWHAVNLKCNVIYFLSDDARSIGAKLYTIV